MSQLKLYLLGAPRVEVDDVALDLPRRKVLALLAYVTLAPKALARDALAAILWPEADHKVVRTSLRRELHTLTSVIGSEWFETTRDEIGLHPQANIWVDVWAFRQALANAPLNDQAEDALLRALALYQGDFMAGFTLSDCPTFDDWQFFEAEALRREYANALGQIVQHLRGQSQYAAAIDHASRWLALDTLAEPVHRVLMELYALTGQAAAAMRQYDECVRILDEELGVEPEAETTALYAAIRTRRFPARAHGESGQGDKMTRWQASEVSRSSPPPASQSSKRPAIAHNLPAQVTSFVGRQEELAEIRQLLLDQKECRLLTLLGPGGVGKTRLALQAAQQFVDDVVDDVLAADESPHFADGVYFVPLEMVSDGEQLLAALADAIGCPLQGNSDPLAQLINFLRPQRLLLLLDNCEHLLEQADLIAALLQNAPALALLATSREAFALQEEWLYAVDGLAPPAEPVEAEPVEAGLAQGALTQAEITAIEANHAVQLFVQRARRADSSLVFTPASLPHIVRICHLVDGLPLGLELAATWVRALSLPEIAAEIAANLDFLTTTWRNAPERHSSLRTVLEQTWRLLTAVEQDRFCRLALFVNGFTRQAANRVADATMLVLAALVRKSIIRSAPSGRYTMHSMLRHFAAAKLNENAALAAGTAEKHSRYFAAFLQALEDEHLGVAHGAALEQIGQEIENIRSGWRWALAHVDDNPEAVKLVQGYVEGIYHFYETRSRFQEGRSAFQHALDQLSALASTQEVQLVLARVYARLGWFIFQIGQPAEGKAHLQHALDLLRALHAQGELIFALNYQGAILRHLGEYEAARQALDESVQICRVRDNRFGLTVALNILGQVAYLQQDYAQAIAYCEESLTLKQAIGDRRGASFSLLYLGLIASAQADYAKAMRLLQESMLICEEFGDRRGIASGLSNLAEVEAAIGRPQRAQALYEESLAIYSEIYNLRGIITTYIRLGDLARSHQRADLARQHYRAALRMVDDLPITHHALAGLLEQARAWLAQNGVA